MLNINNFENNENKKELIFIEENLFNFGNLIGKEDGFYVSVEEKIDFSNMTTLYIYELFMHNSFVYKIINDKIYIMDNNYKQNADYQLKDYLIVNDFCFSV